MLSLFYYFIISPTLFAFIIFFTMLRRLPVISGFAPRFRRVACRYAVSPDAASARRRQRLYFDIEAAASFRWRYAFFL